MIEKTPQPALAEKQNITSLPLRQELAQRNGSEYRVSTDIASELRVATLAYLSIQQEFNRISKAIKANSKPDIKRLDVFIEGLVESIIRNPAAAVWLARLKSKSSYAHRHCISCAILSSVMGRQLGLNRDELIQLALSGLLIDIGKINLPDGLLRKTTDLTSSERAETRSHIALGLDLLEDLPLPVEVLSAVRHHHERFNGCG